MRLIDADDFFRQFSELDIEPYNNVSTIEERPKGKWGDVFHHQGFNYHKCSNCHIAMKVSDYDNYCPNCGADMRGDV